MNNQQLWQAVLGELELSLSKANFTTWFRNTGISSYENDRVVISVPNTFTQSWLEKKYHQNLLKTLRDLTDEGVRDIYYKVESIRQQSQPTIVEQTVETVTQTVQQVVTNQAQKAPARAYVNEFGINAKYHFQNLVVGKHNELAHAAAQAVAKDPGNVYNPLFIYGGVGLGKTHVVQAIGNAILQANPDARIMYASCEKFTNDYINSVKQGRANEFQDKYRNIDVLLMDDIQFITGKEGTQEAFFHTFNALHQNNKQVVITSDRPPKAIATLEARLQSRFEVGLIADVSQPDVETRQAILETKCAAKNFEMDDEIVQYLSENIHENVRELEGALNRIIAQHQLQDTAPTLDSVRKMLAGMKVSGTKKALTPRQLLDTVSEFYGITLADLLGASRKKALVVPRQIVMYLLREEMRKSFPQIGEELGGRDHTTAMHAYDKVGRLLREDEQIKQEVNTIKQQLYAQAHN
jgi:chromosomal replication initiator protein